MRSMSIEASNYIIHDHIVGRDAIRSHKQQGFVVNLVQIPNLALGDLAKRRERARGEHGLRLVCHCSIARVGSSNAWTTKCGSRIQVQGQHCDSIDNSPAGQKKKTTRPHVESSASRPNPGRKDLRANQRPVYRRAQRSPSLRSPTLQVKTRGLGSEKDYSIILWRQVA
jgi:hypothetical protein